MSGEWTIQGIAGIALGPVGVTIGGSIGSGVGTLLTESTDNCFLSDEKKRTSDQILEDSKNAATVALFTSAVSGYASHMTEFASACGTYGLMRGFTPIFKDMMSSFYGAVDDAMTYVILMDK